jgi:hypothetical protein
MKDLSKNTPDLKANKQAGKLDSLKSQVKEYFRVDLSDEMAEQLNTFLDAEEKEYEKTNTVFTDFDWGSIVVDFLRGNGLVKDIGNQWTSYVANKQAEEYSVEEEMEDERSEEPKNEEPSPEDYVMYDSGPLGSRTSVGVVEGDFLGEFKSEDDAMVAIKEDMEKNNFFPGIWRMSDHSYR